MYTRPEQLLEKYPLTVKSFAKGRECFLCDTDKGVVALHEYHGSLERASFLAQMLVHLKENGLIVECIIPDVQGDILVADEEERRFLLTEYYQGAECDVKKEEHMVEAVKKLAELHRISKNFGQEIPDLIQRNSNPVIELYEKHNRELRQIKNYIRSRKKKNEFEALFVKEYDSFYQKAQVVLDRLKSLELTQESYGFCHGDYNHHSIVFSKQGIALVGLEHFTYDLQIKDLANFIRKMMEKNEWDAGLGRLLMESYERERPLMQQERECLYLLLSYPEKFWKLANHYNNARKSWLSERDVLKIKSVILQEGEKENFLKGFSFLKESVILKCAEHV